MGDDTAMLGTTIWLSGAGKWAVPYYTCKLHSHKVDCQHGLQLVMRQSSSQNRVSQSGSLPPLLHQRRNASHTQKLDYGYAEFDMFSDPGCGWLCQESAGTGENAMSLMYLCFAYL
jgi:hypothetical protein